MENALVIYMYVYMLSIQQNTSSQSVRKEKEKRKTETQRWKSENGNEPHKNHHQRGGSCWYERIEIHHHHHRKQPTNNGVRNVRARHEGRDVRTVEGASGV